MANRNDKTQNLNKDISRFDADPELGLTSSQVNERISAGLTNKSVDSPTKTVKEIILGNVFTYFNIIFFAIAAALILVRSFNNLSFLVIITVNLLIGIVQEINSKRTLDSLTLMNEPQVSVIRDGSCEVVKCEDIVLDDVVLFSAGNQICADCIVLDGEVQVNESLVTGESDEIKKTQGDRLLSGSYVVSGECRAKADAVGADSFVSRLTLDAKKSKKNVIRGMMLSLKRLIQVIGILIIPMSIGLLLRHHFSLDMGIRENVQSTAGAIIGMIPEGLYLLVNVTLAVSVIKLAKKNTLVHDLGCIETLAHVDTLCVDKTGTITENNMTVENVISLQNSVDPLKVLEDFVSNMSEDNITMKSLKEKFSVENVRTAVKVVPFSSETKTSMVYFSEREKYVLGAPEYVLKDRYAEYREMIDKYVLLGRRVLVIALSVDDEASLTEKTVPIALIILTNQVRAEAKDTFEYFERQGVDIKVISGDNPRTVSAAAKEAGIPGYNNAVDLTGYSDEKIAEIAGDYTVFGRVRPEQKRTLIRALKREGHTVAMTGDGVNDILAMKDADCSIAMASGSDVTCQIAHLVLMKSQFSSLPSVVAEGRQVINNIERSAALFLVKNIFSFTLALISIFAVFAYPLQPVQISLVSGLTIGIPSFVLALEKNEKRVSGKFLFNVISAALPTAITNLIVSLGVILFAAAFDIDTAVSSSIITLLMGLAGFSMIYRLCRPFNKIRTALMVGLPILFIGALIIMPSFFEISPLGFGGWLIFAVFALLIPSITYVLSLGVEKLSIRVQKRVDKFLKRRSVSRSEG